MLLNMARRTVLRNREFLSACSKKASDGVLAAGLVISLIDTVLMVPFYYLIKYYSAGRRTVEALSAWMKPIMISMLAGTCWACW